MPSSAWPAGCWRRRSCAASASPPLDRPRQYYEQRKRRFAARAGKLEDDGYELAVFHSHLSSPPRPSRTDVENIGLWRGRPYLILSLRTGELAGWRIEDDTIVSVPLSEREPGD